MDLDDAADRHGAYFDERELAKIFRCKNGYLAFIAEQNLMRTPVLSAYSKARNQLSFFG